MGVTSNYSFPVPVATDLVKDGWDAINDLGVAVDTAMNTALGTKKAGMVLLNTTSFSGVASQSINDVFSATYTNYKIIFSDLIVSTSNQNLLLRMRVGGSDLSSAIYTNQQSLQSGTTDTTQRQVSQTSAYCGDIATADKNIIVVDIFNPFATKTTLMIAQGICTIDTVRQSLISNVVGNTISYTGFTFFPVAQNITGSVSTYGYNI